MAFRRIKSNLLGLASLASVAVSYTGCTSPKVDAPQQISESVPCKQYREALTVARRELGILREDLQREDLHPAERKAYEGSAQEYTEMVSYLEQQVADCEERHN